MDPKVIQWLRAFDRVEGALSMILTIAVIFILGLQDSWSCVWIFALVIIVNLLGFTHGLIRPYVRESK